jgi:nicotinamide-nucleotide amidase
MTLLPDDLTEAARRLLEACAKAGNAKIATAESCTGGLIGAALTAIPGSSRWYDRGFVTYANAAKRDMLGVPSAILRQHGAVSPETAIAMAEGALKKSPVAAAVAVTGIAGPDGGTADKPVGLVFMASASQNQPPLLERHLFAGNRDEVRHAAALAALKLLTRTVSP